MPVLRVFRPVAGHRRAVPTIGAASRHHGAARTGVVPRSPGPWQFSTFLFLRSPWGSVWPGRSLIIRPAANDRLSSTVGVMSATGPPAASRRTTYDVIRGIDAAWRKPFLTRSPLSLSSLFLPRAGRTEGAGEYLPCTYRVPGVS